MASPQHKHHKQKQHSLSPAPSPPQQQQQQQQPAAATRHQQQHQHQQQQAAAPVLPWMRVPIAIAAGSGVPLEDVVGLHPALAAAVRQLGFTELFPVQAALWRGLAGGASDAHDMCVCAPTGSGKTLAYALPLLNSILTSCQPTSCHVLRALVVLPTRDLAAQVHSVLHSLGSASGVAVALAAAQESVAAEAAHLTARPSQPGSGPHVLVATPGRLLAHLQGSGGSVLSLRHLRFLVVDEADRLLRQDYGGWLPVVLQHIQRSGPVAAHHGLQLLQQPQLQQQPGSSSGGGIAAHHHPHHQPPNSSSSSSQAARVVKLVVSATLTRDPSKLSRLELACPRFIALAGVERRYALPAGLAQHRLVVPVQHKPLALVALLSRLVPDGRCLVFASSRDTTHRLQLLLAAVPALAAVGCAEYSSTCSLEARRAALVGFRSGATRVLVTSDAMARGMDMEGIAHVVNYEPPGFPKTYVHRAGRTARAGGAGAVHTLCKPEDVVHFNALTRKLAGGGRVLAAKLPQDSLAAHRPALRAALAQVQALVAAEQQQAQQQQQQQQVVVAVAAGAAAGGSQASKRTRDAAAPGIHAIPHHSSSW